MTAAYRAPAPFSMGYHAYVEPDPPDRIHAPPDPRVPDLPRVDQRLVRPETREELFRGRAIIAAPANPPHAECQADVVSLARCGNAKGYVGATEMLTRTGHDSDFATDASIRRAGIDPSTGARYLEELSFEVVAEQSLRDITERARDLSARGVRRIIAIFVKQSEVREWSSDRNDWVLLDPSGQIEDPALVEPIPIRALLDSAAADDAVARALHTKQNPVIMAIAAEGKLEGLVQGRLEGLVQGIMVVCDFLGIPLDAQRRSTLQTLDMTELQSLLDTIHTTRRWP
jgi:hypothetical protein